MFMRAEDIVAFGEAMKKQLEIERARRLHRGTLPEEKHGTEKE